MRLGVCFVFIVLSFGLAPVPQGEFLQQLKNWSGIIEDSALQEKQPKEGVVTGPKDFAMLWKAWRGNEPVPTVDFQSQLVVVVALKKQKLNAINVEVRQGGEAFLTGITASPPLKLEKGFSYVIGVYPREKIKLLYPKRPIPEGK